MKEANDNFLSLLNDDVWYKVISNYVSHPDRVRLLSVSKGSYSFFSRHKTLLRKMGPKPEIRKLDRPYNVENAKKKSWGVEKQRRPKLIFIPNTDLAVYVYRKMNSGPGFDHAPAMIVISLKSAKIIAEYDKNVPDQNLLFSLDATNHVFSSGNNYNFALCSFNSVFQSTSFSFGMDVNEALFTRKFVIQPGNRGLLCFYISDLIRFAKDKKLSQHPMLLGLQHIFQSISSCELLLDSLILVTGNSDEQKNLKVLIKLNDIHDCEILYAQDWLKTASDFTSCLVNTFALSSDNRLYTLRDDSLYRFDDGKPNCIIQSIPFLKDKQAKNLKLFCLDADHIMICHQKTKSNQRNSRDAYHSSSDEDSNETNYATEDSKLNKYDPNLLSIYENITVDLSREVNRKTFCCSSDDEEIRPQKLGTASPTTECLIINIRTMKAVRKLNAGPCEEILVSPNGTIVFIETHIKVKSQIILINNFHQHNLNLFFGSTSPPKAEVSDTAELQSQDDFDHTGSILNL